MKKLFLITFICFFARSCSRQQKEIIKLSQPVSIEHIDSLGNGYYQVYFSYRSPHGGHMIGTGIMTDRQMDIGDIKTYIEYEKENKYGQMESFRDLR